MEEILASIRRIIADDQAAPANGAAAFPPVAGSPEGDLAPDVSVAAGHESAAPPAPVTTALESAGSEIAKSEIAKSEVAEPEIAEAKIPEPDILKQEIVEPPRAEAASPSYVLPKAVPIDAMAQLQPVPPKDAAHTAAPEPEPLYADDPSLSLYDQPAETAYIGPDVGALDPDPFESAAPLLSGSTDSAVASAFNMLAASRLADNSDEIMTLARDMIRPLLRSWIDDNLPGMVERMVRAEIERVARGGR